MDQPDIEQGDKGPQDRVMEARVSRLEEDMRDVRATLSRLEPMIIRIDSAIPYLATKEDVASLDVRTAKDLAGIRVELSRKPSTGGMWAMGVTLVTLVVGGMTAGAVYLPLVLRVMHVPPP